jgi:hypothetical protein
MGQGPLGLAAAGARAGSEQAGALQTVFQAVQQRRSREALSWACTSSSWSAESSAVPMA